MTFIQGFHSVKSYMRCILRKSDFCIYMRKQLKGQISCMVTAQLIRAFVFCFPFIERMIPLLFKSEILSLKPSSVNVQGLGWKPRTQVFSYHRTCILSTMYFSRKSMNIVIPPANCVCGRVCCFHVVRPSVRTKERTKVCP